MKILSAGMLSDSLWKAKISLPVLYIGLLQWLRSKESACNAGATADVGSIPGWGRPPGGKATHSSILDWKIPWTDEAGGLQFMGWQRVGHN